MKALSILALVAGLTMSTATTSSAMTDAEIMGMGHSMLISALGSSLSGAGYTTEDINKLTLNEVGLLQALMTSGDTDEQRRQLKLLLDRVRER